MNGSSFISSPIPSSRPNLESIGRSSSTQTYVQDDVGTDNESSRTGDESDTVESLLKKLEIEKRVQFGAERMLHVIESGEAEGGDKPDVKQRISAQLSESNAKIRALENQMEKLRRSELMPQSRTDPSATPQRPRRRQPLMNAFGNGSSAQPSSLGQTHYMGHGQASRTRLFSSSSLTPERLPATNVHSYQSLSTLASGSGSSSHQSPYSKLRPRSRSTGEDSFGRAQHPNTLIADSAFSWDSPAKDNWANLSMNAEESDEEVAAQLNTIHELLLRLQELATWTREQSNDQWKGKQADRGHEACDVIQGIADILKRSPRVRREALRDELARNVLQYLGDTVSSQLRAASYRTLRYLVVDRQSWYSVMASGVEWMLIRTFTRETKHHVTEKEQALRLMRCGLLLPQQAPQNDPFTVKGIPLSTSPASMASADVGSRSADSHKSDHGIQPASSPMSSPVVVTDGMIRALVSAAENPDDSMQSVCTEFLMEIAVIDVSRLLNSSALRVLLACFKDGPAELCPAMTHILMYLANSPTTRQHLLPRADVETVLVGLTEPRAAMKNGAHVEKFRECARNVGLLLKSWAGLLYLCQYDRHSIKALVGSLRVPVVELRAVILDLIFDVLRIKAPNWMDAFLDGRRLTVYNRTREASTQLDYEPDGGPEEPERPTLVDHYISLLLLVLLDAGLLEALLHVIEEDNSALTRKSTLLMGEILRMANKLLPLQYASQIQALPRLFELAMEFEKPSDRHVALSALSSIDSLARNLARPAAPAQPREETRKRANSVQDPVLRGQRQVQQVKMRMGMQIDDKHFAMLINDTQVVQGRDHTKWNYEILLEAIEGPLLNPKRLEEVIKVSKFMRRLFSFFHPHSQRFSNIQRTRPNQKWVKLACALITTMLANPDGIRYLVEDKLLAQIVDCFSELDQYAGGQFSAQPLFARKRIESTLTYGYFEMIGTLTKHTEGMKLLEKFRFFTSFYHLSELRSRDDIIRATIENFDYAIDGHQRIVLSKALTSNYMETRLFATHTLGSLLEDPDLSAWALRLMLTQLYDPAMEVCDAAVLYLEEACAVTTTLEMVVNMRPSLEHLGEVGHPLFMRFVATSVGFSYLHQAEYIDRELDEWFLTRNLLYVVEAETFVSKTLCPISMDTVEDYWFYEGTAPTHFYGEITKTAAGCQTLRDKGHFAKFAEVIREHGLESEDGAVIETLKSVLWAVGNIGSTSGGLPFLEVEEILGSIVEIAEESLVLTVKGTCFFVLGLISATEQGAELLEEHDWIATRTPMGLPTGICLPLDIAKFAAIAPWQRASRPAVQPLPIPDDEVEIEVMTAISNLANYMLSTGAMNWLKKLRKDHAHLFSSPILLYRVIDMISTNHYRAPVRSFIFDLFDIKLSATVAADLITAREGLKTRPLAVPLGADLLTVPKPTASVSTVGNGPPSRSRALTVSSAGSNEGPAKAVKLEPRQRQTGFVLPETEPGPLPSMAEGRPPIVMGLGQIA